MLRVCSDTLDRTEFELFSIYLLEMLGPLLLRRAPLPTLARSTRPGLCRPGVPASTGICRHFCVYKAGIEAPPPFDTHAAARILRDAGIEPTKVDALVQALSLCSRQTEVVLASQLKLEVLRRESSNEAKIEKRLASSELRLTTSLATQRDELKSLETADYKKLEEELDHLEQRHHSAFQKIMSEMVLLEQRRNSTRAELDEGFNTKLERLENKVMKFAFGATLGLAGVGVGILRLVGSN